VSAGRELGARCERWTEPGAVYELEPAVGAGKALQWSARARARAGSNWPVGEMKVYHWLASADSILRIQT
jgi:hypothetical protein